MSKKKIITHDVGFHPDDVFAVATLLLYLGEENSEVIRSRDPEIIKTGDYVVDNGFVYDPDKNLFDHHQRGGAGLRENGIPYASFGLVWMKFGEELCKSKDVADFLEARLIQPVDAYDNGIDIFKLTSHNVFPYRLIEVIFTFFPTWKESRENVDGAFMEAVAFAEKLLAREIKRSQDDVEAHNAIKDVYNKTKDKKLIVLEEDNSYGRFIIDAILSEFPEPIYFINYRRDAKGAEDPTAWQIIAVNTKKDSLNLRKAFPEGWRGLLAEDLSKLTGVEDAYLCHRSGFMCLAGSKEGAIKLAQLALDA